jgi:hypothetical protein
VFVLSTQDALSKTRVQAEEDAKAHNTSLYGNPFGPRQLKLGEMRLAMRELTRTRREEGEGAAPTAGAPTRKPTCMVSFSTTEKCQLKTEKCQFTMLFVSVTPCAKAATRTATVHRCAITARTCARVPYGESGCEKKGARHRRRSFHAGCCSTIRQYDIHHFVLFCLCAVRNSSTIPQRAVSRRHLLLRTGRRFQPEPTLQDIEIRQNLPDLDV